MSINISDCVFIGFKGEMFENLPRISKSYHLEYWNLKKIPYNNFIRRVKAKIPPVNITVSQNNYSVGTKSTGYCGIGITKKEYESLSWGILFPNYYNYNFYHFTFSLYMYKGFHLIPDMYATNVGIQWIKENNNGVVKNTWFENILLETIQSKFSLFYSKYHKSLSRIIIDYSRIGRWNKEDWRVYMAMILYKDYDKYNREKHLLTWQKEFADAMTIFETLLTAEEGDRTEISYRLTKRFGLLLGNKFPDYSTTISKAYEYRSQFLHGSIYVGLNKRTKASIDEASGITDLMIPKDVWDVSYKLVEYLKYLIFIYILIYEEIVVKSGRFPNVISTLEAGLLDDSVKRDIKKITQKAILALDSH